MKDIAGLAPINKTAAIVTSKGFQYKSTKKILTADSKTPLATIKTNNKSLDLTGMRRGRLTAIGFARDFNGWIVRCDCGVYTNRLAKSIKNKKNKLDRCEECRHLLAKKRAEFYRRTGRDPIEDDLI